MAKDLQVTLPVSGGQLAAVPEVAESARRAEALYGVTLLNDDVARNVVIRHLRKREQQDWYDEAAALLVLGGIAVSLITGNWAAILAVPAGIAVWLRGMNRESAKNSASVHFTAYIGLLNQARRAGLAFRIPTDWGADADRASWTEGPAAAAPPPSPVPPAAYPAAPSSAAAPAQHGSWWPADAVIDPTFPVLPPAALTRHRTLAGRARELGAPYGVDFLDEQAVRALLAAQQRARRVILAWWTVATVALVTGVTVFSIGHDAAFEQRQQVRSAAVGLVAVALVAALPALKAYSRWRGSGLQARAGAYLDLLVEARAYGVPVPVPPAWLDVRNRIRKPS
ncbi:hypothetical protein [Kitasatospora sp. NPDC018619]|uniref:hypothetical protein n=1 Tax=unclassified Kitasatospora TaxID=2633591 RepID=UPI0037B9695B